MKPLSGVWPFDRANIINILFLVQFPILPTRMLALLLQRRVQMQKQKPARARCGMNFVNQSHTSPLVQAWAFHFGRVHASSVVFFSKSSMWQMGYLTADGGYFQFSGITVAFRFIKKNCCSLTHRSPARYKWNTNLFIFMKGPRKKKKHDKLHISGPGRGPQHIVTISLPRFGSYWSTLGATLNAVKLEFPRKGPSGEPYFHTSGDVFGGAPCWRPKCLECFQQMEAHYLEEKHIWKEPIW